MLTGFFATLSFSVLLELFPDMTGCHDGIVQYCQSDPIDGQHREEE